MLRTCRIIKIHLEVMYTSCGIVVYSLALSIDTAFTSKSFIVRIILLASAAIYNSKIQIIYFILVYCICELRISRI